MMPLAKPATTHDDDFLEPIMVRDLRIRYEVPFMFSDRVAIHGIVTTFQSLAYHVRCIKDAGYKIVGVDERYREEGKRLELDQGWREIERRK